jgi:hypothetical protein
MGTGLVSRLIDIVQRHSGSLYTLRFTIYISLKPPAFLEPRERNCGIVLVASCLVGDPRSRLGSPLCTTDDAALFRVDRGSCI